MSRVFIVEDEVLVARDIKSRLEKLGYRVLGTAARGDDAVARILADQPDLILMDINLKGEMDGIEAADRIRAKADLPIIFCTAYSNDETLARAKVTVPYGYVLKPFDNRELEITIEIALHKHQLESALKQASHRLDATLQNLSDAVVTVNQAGQIVLANPMSEKMLVQGRSEILGRDGLALLTFTAFNEGEPQLDVSNLLKGSDSLPQGRTRQRLVREGLPALPVEVTLNTVVVGEESLLVLALRDLTTQIEQEEQLVRTAFFDSLTALPNRQLFMDRLSSRLVMRGENSTSGEQAFAVLMLSIEGVSEINQGLGFAAGDHVIKEVALRLQQVTRIEDTLAHFGGGRFALLMTNTNDGGLVLSKLEKLQANIHANINWRPETKVNVVSHCGLVFGPGVYESSHDVIRDGEIALSRARAEGVNYAIFDEAMHAKAKELLTLRSALQEAIDRQLLVPFYQPIVDLKSLKIQSFEALVRWPMEDASFLSPSTFVPLAESTGLILLLGDLMLETVCRQQQIHTAKGFTQFSIAVNISSDQFNDDLVNRLDQLVAQYELSPEQVSIEITEGVAMAAIESNLKLLEALRGRGHKISVDDFGTGYSSLAYLKRFPLDTLKIDRAFVQELKVNSDDYIIAKAIIDLGHSLGLKIIAEGIETAEQLKILQNLNCDLGQGYYFQKAVPAQDLVQCYEAGLPLGRAQTL